MLTLKKTLFKVSLTAALALGVTAVSPVENVEKQENQFTAENIQRDPGGGGFKA